jgi:osmotically inducible protein OsmC
MPTSTASARYEGLGKPGKGSISTASGVLHDQPYGFGTRFEGKPGTNPEELIAAAHAACFHHGNQLCPGQGRPCRRHARHHGKVTLEADGDGFKVTRSALALKANVPGIARIGFARIADEAKANCPISRLLNCEVTLERTLES